MVALAVEYLPTNVPPLLPNAPTLVELGHKDSAAYLPALVVPAGTSQQIIAKVHDDVAGYERAEFPAKGM